MSKLTPISLAIAFAVLPLLPAYANDDGVHPIKWQNLTCQRGAPMDLRFVVSGNTLKFGDSRTMLDTSFPIQADGTFHIFYKPTAGRFKEVDYDGELASGRITGKMHYVSYSFDCGADFVAVKR